MFEYIVMRKMLFSSEKPPKHDVPDLYRSLHRICFYLELCLQFRQHGNMSIIKMWSFLKNYDGAQPGKRKTAN